MMLTAVNFGFSPDGHKADGTELSVLFSHANQLYNRVDMIAKL